MENEIITGIETLTNMIAEKILENIKGKIENIVQDINITPRSRQVKGERALANELEVSLSTINRLKKEGLLDDAMKVNYGRITIYDIDKAMECLNHKYISNKRKYRRG